MGSEVTGQVHLFLTLRANEYSAAQAAFTERFFTPERAEDFLAKPFHVC